MSDYKKLIEALRCVEHEKLACPDCTERDCYANSGRGLWCRVPLLLEDAAAAIEELLSFAHYVADKVTMSDEDWEDYHEAFAEVACRKLVKLGVISIEDDMYVYRHDELWQEVHE